MFLKTVGTLAALLALSLLPAQLTLAAAPTTPVIAASLGALTSTFLLVGDTFVDVSEFTDYDDGHVYVNSVFVGTLGNDGGIYDSEETLVGYATFSAQ